jgi:hypothetical protein
VLASCRDKELWGLSKALTYFGPSMTRVEGRMSRQRMRKRKKREMIVKGTAQPAFP